MRRKEFYATQGACWAREICLGFEPTHYHIARISGPGYWALEVEGQAPIPDITGDLERNLLATQLYNGNGLWFPRETTEKGRHIDVYA